MSLADLKKTTERKMEKSLEALRTDLAKVRTGRAHTGLLDHVQVGLAQPLSLAWSIALRLTRTQARAIGPTGGRGC